MTNYSHIGIAGAGLIGRLLAWRLARSGIKVEIFDGDAKDGTMSCAHVAGGMLAPFSEFVNCDSDVAKLGLDSLSIWEDWLSELDEVVRMDRRGILILAHSRDLCDLKHFGLRLLGRLKSARFPLALERLGEERISQLEPQLAGRFTEGLYLPLEGHIDSRQLMSALAKTLENEKVFWHDNVKVDSIESNRLIGKNLDRQFDFVVDCRGTGSRSCISGLRGVRGESIHLQAPAVLLNHPIRLIHPRHPLYLVPRDNGQLLLGATQIESDDFSPMSAQSALELLSGAVVLHSGLREARILSFGANCRPAMLDNRPAIDCKSGLMRINGLFRHGFMCAPAIINECLSFIMRGTFSCEFEEAFVNRQNELSSPGIDFELGRN